MTNPAPVTSSATRAETPPIEPATVEALDWSADTHTVWADHLARCGAVNPLSEPGWFDVVGHAFRPVLTLFVARDSGGNTRGLLPTYTVRGFGLWPPRYSYTVSDDQVTIRPLETRAEHEACVALQRDIWGQDFADVVPATILMVSQQVGGVASGAFDARGRLIGFVFGISGVRNRVTAHWSDMLAVRPEARGRGLGRRLKLHQRELLLAVGIERVYWTFDPLVARAFQRSERV